MSLLAGLVAIADGLTKNFGLQATVTYEAYAGPSGGSGKRSYGQPIVRQAIVTKLQKQVTTFSGSLGVSTAQVVFLDPTVVNEFDRITLPDGTIQPIIGTAAFVDDTQAGILTEIFLGAPGSTVV